MSNTIRPCVEAPRVPAGGDNPHLKVGRQFEHVRLTFQFLNAPPHVAKEMVERKAGPCKCDNLKCIVCDGSCSCLDGFRRSLRQGVMNGGLSRFEAVKKLRPVMEGIVEKIRIVCADPLSEGSCEEFVQGCELKIFRGRLRVGIVLNHSWRPSFCLNAIAELAGPANQSTFQEFLVCFSRRMHMEATAAMKPSAALERLKRKIRDRCSPTAMRGGRVMWEEEAEME